MTLHDDPRTDPFLTREPEANGARFAHLFREVTTFKGIDEVWRSIDTTERWADADEALEAAVERSRALRAEGATITLSSDEVWEEWGLPQNDVELVVFLSWMLEADFFVPREMEEAFHHHAQLRRNQLLAAGVVSGPAPF